MKYKWYRVAWNILWLPLMYLARVLFSVGVMFQHLSIKEAVRAWKWME